LSFLLLLRFTENKFNLVGGEHIFSRHGKDVDGGDETKAQRCEEIRLEPSPYAE
jgi:hypothetical protein